MARGGFRGMPGGMNQQALMKQEANLDKGKKKHYLGALALFLPILYNLADVFSIAEINGIQETVGVQDSGMVSPGEVASIPAIDFFIFECVGFVLVAFGVWLYMLIVKKYTYNPFQEEEMVRCSAATGETFGTMTFILASAINPVLTAPIVSSYCLVTIVLARIFLKERLTKKQNQGLLLLVIGIALVQQLFFF